MIILLVLCWRRLYLYDRTTSTVLEELISV